MTWSADDIPDLTGRTAVVTGANGGLGLATAAALAAKGAHVVMAARNQTKTDAARRQLLASTPTASLEIVELDLGSLASVQRAAQEIADRHDAIDILVNNAGVMATPQGETSDGFETQLGINHLGHWALTSQLLPVIVRTPGARVVTLTSTAQHMGRPLDPDDPHLRRSYDPWRAYGQSKLANRHFAQGLDGQFRTARLDAMALTAHPGLSRSELQTTAVARGGGGGTARFFDALVHRIGMTVERGALSQLRAATDPAASGGSMYAPLWVNFGPPVRKPLVRPGSDAAIRVLWQVSRQETSLDVDVAAALAST
jgi:NAD(P)-dependent dehydrogenase (short-subunit alcohol dehydrogenase family)